MASRGKKKKQVAVPKVSTEDQIKIFDLVKSGLTIEEALVEAKKIEHPNKSPRSPSATQSPVPVARNGQHPPASSPPSDSFRQRSSTLGLPSRRRKYSGGSKDASGGNDGPISPRGSNDNSNSMSRSASISSASRRRYTGNMKKAKKNDRSAQDRATQHAEKQAKREATCVVCGSKITVLQTPVVSGTNRFHSECASQKRPCHARTLSPSDACHLVPENVTLNFAFRGHMVEYSFEALNDSIQGDASSAQMSFVAVDHASCPASQMWPALIAGFGLPDGMVVSGSEFYAPFYECSSSGTDRFILNRDEGAFAVNTSLQIYGLNHQLTMVFMFNNDDCYVTAESATLIVSDPATDGGDVGIDLAHFLVLGGNNTQAVNYDDSSRRTSEQSEVNRNSDSDDDDRQPKPRARPVSVAVSRPPPTRRAAPVAPQPSRPAPAPPTAKRVAPAPPQQAPQTAMRAVPVGPTEPHVYDEPLPVDPSETSVRQIYDEPLPENPIDDEAVADEISPQEASVDQSGDQQKGSMIGLPTPWEMTEDDSGHVYYFNSDSLETSWDVPLGAVYWYNEVAHEVVTLSLAPGAGNSENRYGIQLDIGIDGIPYLSNQGWVQSNGSLQLEASAKVFIINNIDVVSMEESDVMQIIQDGYASSNDLICIVSPMENASSETEVDIKLTLSENGPSESVVDDYPFYNNSDAGPSRTAPVAPSYSAPMHQAPVAPPPARRAPVAQTLTQPQQINPPESEEEFSESEDSDDELLEKLAKKKNPFAI